MIARIHGPRYATVSKIINVNRLKGKVTMLFIAHQLPKGLQTDGVITVERTGKAGVVHYAKMAE